MLKQMKLTSNNSKIFKGILTKYLYAVMFYRAKHNKFSNICELGSSNNWNFRRGGEYE